MADGGFVFTIERCVLCQKEFDQNTQAVVVYKKGLATLIRLSKERVMDTLSVYLQEMQCENENVKMQDGDQTCLLTRNS